MGSVADNLQRPYTLQIHQGKHFDQERILRLLEVLGQNASFLDKSSRDLSGGEAQIVALRRAIQLDYQILIMFLIASGTALGTVSLVPLSYRRLFHAGHQFRYPFVKER
jgi:ABC-type iron transport system FetAB ATPase subunit